MHSFAGRRARHGDDRRSEPMAFLARRKHRSSHVCPKRLGCKTCILL
jgi:hypothetical protein